MKTYKMKTYQGDESRIIVSEDFVTRNKFFLDINAALECVKNPSDMFGFESSVAMDILPFNKIKNYCNEEYIKAVESKEITHTQINDIYEVVQDFLDYMVFAWSKARDERGLSASRSIIKLSAWMKILGRPDIADILNDDSLYDSYGKPALRKACVVLGISCPEDIK